ncbi:MAG: oxidoreductase, partial [Dehalococcoidia bacterium]|nr:oxidoreductase [Dehalococcoidia bacterium]
ITSDRASILGIIEEAPDVASGVISMAHAWGDVPELDHEVRTIGSHTGRLMANDRDFDPYTGIPRMSAIPVNLRKVEESLPV